ncbi:MAG: adenylate kinase [Clostridia bacterium]|jgi:adenylate kinase|nr:adenylate kinase [Clostridia bacterium]
MTKGDPICSIQFYGGPAAGKGTMSKILCAELQIPHISTGDLLRKLSETDPDIHEKLSKGIYISDEITTKLLYERISQVDCLNGCVIDGYPRNLNQAHLLNNMLQKLGKNLTAAIELTVPDSIVFERILKRKACPKCGKIYGLTVPSKVENICDDCKLELVTRSDDNEETLKIRIDLYKSQVKPILDYYKEQGILVTIEASSNPEKILDVIKL